MHLCIAGRSWKKCYESAFMTQTVQSTLSICPLINKMSPAIQSRIIAHKFSTKSSPTKRILQRSDFSVCSWQLVKLLVTLRSSHLSTKDQNSWYPENYHGFYRYSVYKCPKSQQKQEFLKILAAFVSPEFQRISIFVFLQHSWTEHWMSSHNIWSPFNILKWWFSRSSTRKAFEAPRFCFFRCLVTKPPETIHILNQSEPKPRSLFLDSSCRCPFASIWK